MTAGGKLASVTGATGLLGGNLVTELLAQGWRVRATRRQSSRTDHLDHLAIDWVTATLDDTAALVAAFQEAAVVFHCAASTSIRARATPGLVAANVEGTANVLEAVRAAGSPRLVYVSSTVAVGLGEDGRPADEETRWNLPEAGLDDGYATTKRRGEELAMAAAADGLDVVVVNPGFLFGPLDARLSSGRLIRDVVKGRAPGTTPGCNSFTDVRDVARGMVLAAERGQAGRRYILAGHNLSYAEVFARIAAVAGTKAPTLRVPRWLASVIGLFGDAQEKLTGGEPLINSTALRWAFCDRFVVSSARAEAELGYAISPLEPAIEAAVAWFGDRGVL